MRLLRLAAPTFGTALLRLAQLAALLAISRLTSGEAQSFLLTGLGLLASFTIVSDAGAANYLLSVPLKEQTVATYRKALLLQAAAAALGAIIFLAFVSAIAPSGVRLEHILLLLALLFSQLFDSLSRAAKAPLLVSGQDHLFALPDIAAGLGKLAVIGAALVSGTLWCLALTFVVSACALAWAVVAVARTLPAAADARPGLVKQSLEIGLTGSLSAAYSQSPMFFAAAMLPLETSAVFAVLYRVVQSLELLPATASTQLVPRVGERTAPLRLWGSFVAAGSVLAIALILAWPIIADLAQTPVPFELAVPVTAAFALKSGGYALVAYLLGRRLVRQRLIITLTTGAIALAGIPAVIVMSGAPGLALSAPVLELVFLTVTIIVLRGAQGDRQGKQVTS